MAASSCAVAVPRMIQSQMPTKRWKAPEQRPQVQKKLQQELGIHALTASLLVNRGLNDSEQVVKYLNPSLHNLHDPYQLPDMDKAAHRIADAIHKQETILVYGDYDVDGVTSTALYVRALAALGAKFLYKVPHRQKDGYDIRAETVQWAQQQNVSLLITSDCGIQAHAVVDLANFLGINTVVTDHHEPGDTLPAAYAVVNPHRHDSNYPFPYLAGVGVAFKVMQAVVRLMKPEYEQSYIQRFLDLVACGTVADVMPLTDENRILASHGLAALSSTRKVGLRSLLEGAKIDLSKPLNADTVGFGIGPRINAVGRLDDASLALDLLLTNDPEAARGLVDKLNKHNLARREEQQRIFLEALVLIAEKKSQSQPVIVLASKGWNSGVVGIVAGKIVERYHRPAIVISLDDKLQYGKGSARSIAAFDIHGGISHCRDLLINCGGHELAAGLFLSHENLPLFEQKLCSYASNLLTEDDFIPTLKHDGAIEPADLSLELLDEWQRFAPFGQGNPEPCFTSHGQTVNELRRIGKDSSHLKMRLGHVSRDSYDCVGWGLGEWCDMVSAGDSVDTLYIPQINEWNGRRTVQLNIKDVRVSI